MSDNAFPGRSFLIEGEAGISIEPARCKAAASSVRKRGFPAGSDGEADLLVPGYIAMVIATNGLMGLPETLASYHEQGILRRQRATPVAPIVILGTHMIVNMIVTTIGLTLLVSTGVLFYNVNMPIEPLGVSVAVLISALSFFTLSFLFARVASTVRVAQAIGAALYFPMIFFSGATWPREALPELARRIG